jgi:membrane fusion protein, multidrug efflux system
MANSEHPHPEAGHEGISATPGDKPPTPPSPPPAHPPAPAHPLRKWIIIGAILIGVVASGIYLRPVVATMVNTISTDDAYVNGHVTFVAPRVAGQVKRVLVDDNNRVKKGDLLVELDKEPFLVQLEIKKAQVETAKADLIAAQAQVRGLVAQTRANRFKLDHAMEDVNNQVANLRGAVENLRSKRATLVLAKNNLQRGEELAPKGGISKEDLDQRRQLVRIDQAAVDQALQQIYAIRAGLGLPLQPRDGAAEQVLEQIAAISAGLGVPVHLPKDEELAEVPADLTQNFSTVRQALADLMQSAAQFGYFSTSFNATPKQVIAEFYKQDPRGNFDSIIAKLIPDAPPIKQAEAKLLQAQSDLAQAELNLRYCDIVSEIDGQVTRRNVNPGNFVQVGQNLMAVRSLTEIWIDANFKETQLADLRIGQRVRIEVDMYGDRHEYKGRISGFTMGTGQTLSLLPPQNATGNFVKIVQRLPVRIDLVNYDPEKSPLFIGLSVEPFVYYREPPTGPHAGEFLQPSLTLPRPKVSRP